MPRFKDGVIRQLRERRCWSQEDLARRAGVSIRTLQRAEAGESTKLDTVAFVAEALEVSPEDIVESDAPHGVDTDESEGAKQRRSQPIPVVLHRMMAGKDLLDAVSGSHAMIPETRGTLDAHDAKDIGSLLDEMRDFMDISSEMSYSDQLRYGVELNETIQILQARGWWVLAGQKRHSIVFATGDGQPMPWSTCVVMVARADDSVIVHREYGEPVARVFLPERFGF